MTFSIEIMRVVAVCLSVFYLAGCGAHANRKAPLPPCTADCLPSQDENTPLDPFEPINRHILNFNRGFSTIVFDPIIRVYRLVTLPEIRRGISNFLLNLTELPNSLNILLQKNPKGALRSLERFAINSTLGVFGIFDVAATLDLAREHENFGRTMAVWGIKPGPYAIMPFFGASTFRGVVGFAADSYTTPLIAPYAYIGQNTLTITGQNTLTINVARFIASGDRVQDGRNELYRTQVDPYIALRAFYLNGLEQRKKKAEDKDIVIDENSYDNITDFDDF